eukprot:TRINITY_DN135_c0_g1_i5.p1 TRINITY_DN135_c0_g1~~TRINITY_DN135_c0_g1_i5.p1  ORF type:complete len:800 (-),score=250.75 TRINITY_DN135_c0_g1_i5:1317-3716(-)
MGFLEAVGAPLSWTDEDQGGVRERVKDDGVTQFLEVYRKTAGRTNDVLKWGDEIEYTLLASDTSGRRTRLLLRAAELLEILSREEHATPAGSTVAVLWRPEYANWMIEGTPGTPYRCYAADLDLVEQNMALRRREVAALLEPGQSVMTLTAFPRIGCEDSTVPPTSPYGPYARSFYTSDDVITPHPRFRTLTRNIRFRRGGKVDIRVPLFRDERTPTTVPVLPPGLVTRAAAAADGGANGAAEPAPAAPASTPSSSAAPVEDNAYTRIEDAADDRVDYIGMDSMAFGMGLGCLQVTLQARDMDESRHLYDQLAVMAPLMLAVSAATPVLRGLLADTDVRWNVIAASVDDRTPAERAGGVITKSRYDSIDCYISPRVDLKPEVYNDIPVALNGKVYTRLVDAGIDERLAEHVAHLYVRQPLVIFSDRIEVDNTATTEHFENIQSTNWNTVRFKPPPPGSDIGWRTEFRSMDVQLTDFENAAFSVFIVLLSRVIIAFDLNLYVPMSAVDVNMAAAHERGAAPAGRFTFRKNIFRRTASSIRPGAAAAAPAHVPHVSADGDRAARAAGSFLCECGHLHQAVLKDGAFEAYCDDEDGEDPDAVSAMTLDEIFNGKPLDGGFAAGQTFPGLIPLVKGYLASLALPADRRMRLTAYLDFVGDRAAGRLMTAATYMRRFLEAHPAYAQDSVVSEDMTHDLIVHLSAIVNGDVRAPELLGEYYPSEASLAGSAAAGAGAELLNKMRRELSGGEAVLHGSSVPASFLDKALRPRLPRRARRAKGRPPRGGWTSFGRRAAAALERAGHG